MNAQCSPRVLLCLCINIVSNVFVGCSRNERISFRVMDGFDYAYSKWKTSISLKQFDVNAHSNIPSWHVMQTTEKRWTNETNEWLIRHQLAIESGTIINKSNIFYAHLCPISQHVWCGACLSPVKWTWYIYTFNCLLWKHNKGFRFLTSIAWDTEHIFMVASHRRHQGTIVPHALHANKLHSKLSPPSPAKCCEERISQIPFGSHMHQKHESLLRRTRTTRTSHLRPNGNGAEEKKEMVCNKTVIFLWY